MRVLAPWLTGGAYVQVRECAKALVMVCKQTLGIPVFLVGHVTKGGDLAGPKTLEHIVDTTLYLEGEESSTCRVLRSSKNRHVCMCLCYCHTEEELCRIEGSQPPSC